MTSSIHPTAIIDPAAKLGNNLTIGPYCIVGGEVELGDNITLMSHVVINGRTRIGAGTTVFPFASLGQQPQDLKYHGELSTLEIGENNQIREYVTMNPGTEGGGMLTRVGSNSLFMVGAHIAHDCIVGNNVVIANYCSLAGHVICGDNVIVGGHSAVRQFVRIGAHAMIGGMSAVENDIIPFATVKGDRAYLAGLNIIGMERHKFTREDITALRGAYKLLFGDEGTLIDRIEQVAAQFGAAAPVGKMLDFVRARSNTPLCQPSTDR